MDLQLMPIRSTAPSRWAVASRLAMVYRRPALSAVLIGATVLTSHPANAALGGTAASVTTDAKVQRASIKSTEMSNYRVQTIDLPTGTVLREYVAPSGIVFAVAWIGPRIPNLQQTLGTYFNTFVTGAGASRMGHHHLLIRQSDFVMESSGHMRAFTGRAYLPQAIPAGVSLDELH